MATHKKGSKGSKGSKATAKDPKNLPNPFEDDAPSLPTPEDEASGAGDASGATDGDNGHLEDMVKTMAAQMSSLVDEQQRLREELKRARGGGPSSGNLSAGQVPSAKEAMSQILRREEIERSTEQSFWARMTPFDQDAGNVAHSRGFGYLTSKGGQYLRGGTGLAGDVPQWRRVTKEEATKLAVEKQYPMRRYSRAACQIVTNKGRKMIDAYEEMYRQRTGGMRAVSVSEAAMEEGTMDAGGGIIEDARPSLATPRVSDQAQEASPMGDGSGKAAVSEIGPDQRQAAAQVLADLPDGGTTASG